MSKKKKKTKNKKVEQTEENLEKINGNLIDNNVLVEKTDSSNDLYDKSRFGEPVSGKYQYALVEALYLIEKDKLEVKDKKKILDFNEFLKKARKIEPNFWVRYCVFKDLRKRGYIVKTALKFGADFRVYDRGVKPGEDHAKWVVFPVHEGSMLTWREFSAKNRVAHSTRKKLLIGIVDEEGDPTYYEISWIRP